MNPRNARHGCLGLVLIATVMLFVVTAAAQSGKTLQNALELPPGSAELIQPEELSKTLLSGSSKPVVLYVGPHFLYAQAHIPGAEFIGPASDPHSLESLRTRVAALPKNSSIVLYCGCCPWEHCPNIRPAYKELQRIGFKGVRVLYLANNFGTNWVEKGYPIEKGSSAR
jgi:3-mercaptopyruvate sulfurtransferase SseA